MEWQNFQEKQREEEEMRVETELGQFQTGGLFVKVMTDEQMELLRKQIAVYTMLCEQLAQMHKAFSVQHDITGKWVYFHCLNDSMDEPSLLFIVYVFASYFDCLSCLFYFC